MLAQPYLLVAGCSHTEGVGVDPDQNWAHYLAQSLNCNLVNLGRAGACAKFVSDTLIDYLSNTSIPPQLVVAQWPNPYRSMKLVDRTICFYNIHSMDQDFEQRLKNNPNDFVDEWSNSIIKFNSFCHANIVNICLESKQDFIIQTMENFYQKDIILHIDEKLPGKTWHFDSSARDRLHHSAECHQKWADRILTILENPV
jgi:hypothetical protein